MSKHEQYAANSALSQPSPRGSQTNRIVNFQTGDDINLESFGPLTPSNVAQAPRRDSVDPQQRVKVSAPTPRSSAWIPAPPSIPLDSSLAGSFRGSAVPLTPAHVRPAAAVVNVAADDPDDDLSRSAVGSISSVGTDASTGTAAHERNIGTTSLRACGAKIRVPFTVWTFAAMVVPIALVVMSGALQLSASVKELDIIGDHERLALVVGKCTGTLMQERGTLGPWIARGDPVDLARLNEVRAGVDEHCASALTAHLQSLSHGSSAASSARWQRESSRHVELLRALSVWRGEVDARRADGRQARQFLTLSITATSEMLVIVADALKGSGRAYSALFVLMGTRNYIGLARGVGNAIAALSPGNPAVDALGPEYLGGYAQSQTAHVMMLALAEPALRTRLDEWSASSLAREMWWLLDTMADPAGGMARVQQNNASTWWPTVSAGLNALHEIEELHLADVLAGEARSDVLDAALFVSFGVVACLAAAGLLARLQSRVRHQLEEQMARARQTKAAVSAFVPRFFLQKMGYTSITQVRAGEATTVALTMLFSDIRRFTTVSEGMQSSDLFDWVQGYFKLMTTIVEGRRGNVNQFVGDAMFAVFSAPCDALQCAVDMQASVDQLNLDRLREDAATVPIEVGVGIHHDVVALGILGDDKRHTCTAISASVNLASRLEGLTKQLGCKILASDAAVDQLSSDERQQLRLRRLGPVVVKGSAAAVTVHDVFHADVREVQLYKSETQAAFEELATACLNHKPTAATQLELKRQLRRLARHDRGGTGVVATDETAGAALANLSMSRDSTREIAGHPHEMPRTAVEAPALNESPQEMDRGVRSLLAPATMPHSHDDVSDHSVNRELPHHGPAAVSIADGLARTRALIDHIVASLLKHGVRDPAIEAVAVLADGSGSLCFVAK